MSKCRTAFEKFAFEAPDFETMEPYDIAVMAWNAAIARAAEICYHEAGVYTKEDAARAIERENEHD